MVRKLPDELLPDHTGRAENAYLDFFGLHGVFTSFTARGPHPRSPRSATSRLARAAGAFKKKPADLFGGRRVL